MEDYKRGSHTVWDCKYHLVWTTKYRYQCLVAMWVSAAEADGAGTGSVFITHADHFAILEPG